MPRSSSRWGGVFANASRRQGVSLLAFCEAVQKPFCTILTSFFRGENASESGKTVCGASTREILKTETSPDIRGGFFTASVCARGGCAHQAESHLQNISIIDPHQPSLTGGFDNCSGATAPAPRKGSQKTRVPNWEMPIVFSRSYP